MKRIILKKGLNLPLQGDPEQKIYPGNPVTKVALLGSDYPGMKPRFKVKEGDKVKLGQLLFIDKKNEAVKFTAPAAGTVTAINRGEKRKFLSLIIECDGKEEITFSSYAGNKLNRLGSEKIIHQLLQSGLWTALRSRPFGKVADPETRPHSIFVTAMDTNPLAPSIPVILKEKKENFLNGLSVLAQLSQTKIYLCKKPGEDIPQPDSNTVSVAEFKGPHPAGNPGTHIHFLDPVSLHKQVWYIGAQDVAAIGYLFTQGKISMERLISLAGPLVKNPRLVRTRMGASVDELVRDELHVEDCRIISGSVFSGHTAENETAFLGRYHQQISVIPVDKKECFLGWLSPGFNLYSLKNVFISKFIPGNRYRFTTCVHGGTRAVVPVESYEKVMPLDLLPNYLLRALAVQDIEEAENLGCLELVEEDLALCSFVCPSKIDHGKNLRKTLDLIEKEG